jgi:cation:H+ antiporter
VAFLWFAVGLALLAVGAELLVRGASRLAAAAGVSPLVIGLTVVAYGTSTPELTVSVQAAWRGASDLALGNVVGSNIFNVLFILGVSAVAAPLVVASQVIRREVPIMIAVSIVSLLVALDGLLSRFEGCLLLVGITTYTIGSIVASRRERASVREEFAAAGPSPKGGHVVSVLFVAAGLALLVVGTGWVVDNAVFIARSFGVSELVIGLTLVAAGTSLPELATSVLAAVRGQRDIAVGNVVGSNIYNILAILGAAAVVSPIGVSDAALWFDIPVMIAVALASLPIFLSHARITRPEGSCLLLAYIAYTAYLALEASQHEALPLYRTAMASVVLPLAAIALMETLRRWSRGGTGSARDLPTA